MNETQQDSYLVISKAYTDIVNIAIDCILLLSSKRTTLEDKAIAKYLHLAIIECTNILKSIHFCLANNLHVDKELLEELSNANSKIKETLDEFLKMLKYDFNFFEQYFEFDFLIHLNNENNFLEKLQNISSLLTKSSNK